MRVPGDRCPTDHVSLSLWHPPSFRTVFWSFSPWNRVFLIMKFCIRMYSWQLSSDFYTSTHYFLLQEMSTLFDTSYSYSILIHEEVISKSYQMALHSLPHLSYSHQLPTLQRIQWPSDINSLSFLPVLTCIHLICIQPYLSLLSLTNFFT